MTSDHCCRSTATSRPCSLCCGRAAPRTWWTPHTTHTMSSTGGGAVMEYLRGLQLVLLIIYKSLLPGSYCWLVAALARGPQSLSCRERRRPGSTAASWRGMKRQKSKLRGKKCIFPEFSYTLKYWPKYFGL